jgi:hypothetical protein
VAFFGKYYETKWHFQKTVRWLMPKLREAVESTSTGALRFLSALALAKPALKAIRLFRFDGFFQWKAEKSPNKHSRTSFWLLGTMEPDF